MYEGLRKDKIDEHKPRCDYCGNIIPGKEYFLITEDAYHMCSRKCLKEMKKMYPDGE